MKRTPTRLLQFMLCACFAMPAAAQRPAGQAGQGGSDADQLEATLAFVRQRNAQTYAIATPRGVDEERFVQIGGIDQWITIRGQDRDNPVLLFLHGGPGDATNPWGYAGFQSWLKHFTVVQWDQRGAGRTLGKHGQAIADTITLDRMTQDGLELAAFLRDHLHKEKIILVGHSWGSILGLMMAKAKPEIFYAFVGTGQVADPSKSSAVAYRDLLKKAQATGNERAIRELAQAGPPPYANGLGHAVQRKWSNLFEHADLFLASTLGLALGAPGYSPRDINEWFEGQGLSAERLVPVTNRLKAKDLQGDYRLPVFVIQGAEDFTTPASLARALVESIHAPDKAFIPIEGGGHFTVFIRPEAFLQALVPRLLPLVRKTKPSKPSRGSSESQRTP